MGFNYGSVTLRSAKNNMVLARQHPKVVPKSLQGENGRVVGPLESEVASEVTQVSRFGVFPKGHTPGKWRLIVDLSVLPTH